MLIEYQARAVQQESVSPVPVTDDNTYIEKRWQQYWNEWAETRRN